MQIALGKAVEVSTVFIIDVYQFWLVNLFACFAFGQMSEILYLMLCYAHLFVCNLLKISITP